jgi:hypothetical protein
VCVVKFCVDLLKLETLVFELTVDSRPNGETIVTVPTSS